MTTLHSGDEDVKEDGIDRPAPRRRGWISPGLSLILIGGAAFGSLVCMCLAVALVAVWTGS